MYILQETYPYLLTPIAIRSLHLTVRDVGLAGDPIPVSIPVVLEPLSPMPRKAAFFKCSLPQTV